MRSVLLSLAFVSLFGATAHAQLATARPLAELSAQSSELRALQRLAGDRTRAVVDESGALRTIFGAAMPQTGDSFEAGALAFLNRFGPLFGVPHGATYRVNDVVSAHGFSVAHVVRVIEGREIALASIVVRARPDGLIDLVHVDAMPSSAPVLAPVDLRAVVGAGIAAPGYDRPEAVSTRELLLSLEGALRPAIEVEVSGARRTERARVYVDAATSEVIVVEQLVLDAMGRVYETNPMTDPTPIDIELTDLTSRDFLTGRHARVSSCDQTRPDCPLVSHAVADAAGDFLLTPDLLSYIDGFAEVNAYYHATRVVSYMLESHGFTWECGGASSMAVIVNYTETPGVAYDNAAFSPGFRSGCGYLLFGQGIADDFAYDGDVVYHEYGHAVTDAITDLGFFGTGNSPNYDPLAINEGTSDYWASAVQGNAEIAESISIFEGGRGGSLRTIDGDLTCPDDLIGEGHYDGRLWSGLGWASRTAIGQERTDAMFYVAVMTTSGSTSLTEAAMNFTATAMSYQSMGMLTADELAMVEAAVTARGLDDCPHVVPLDDGRAHEGYSGTEFITGALAHGLAPLQYSLEVPADLVSIEIDVEHATFAGEVTVHISSGLPVRSSGTRVASSAQFPIGRSGTAVVGPADGVVPCQRLYIGIETTDLRTAGQSLYSIIARMNLSGDPTAMCPAPMPDAGPSDASTEDAGIGDGGGPVAMTPACGCRAGSGSGAPSAALSVAAVMLALSRRRRR